MKSIIYSLFLLLISLTCLAQKGEYETVPDFGARFFSEPAKWQTLWINKASREDIEQILGRRFSGLRIRYWGENNRSGWIFEEIGKEQPITVGVIIEENAITDVSVLAYRESRGGEVRYPFFTEQFKQAVLKQNSSYQLDRHIDGITGATLSVRALKKIATLALYCHQQTPFSVAN